MAKKPKPEAENGAAESSTEAPAGATVAPSITIQGLIFPVAAPYEEGHQCNSAEAATLNQTRHENLRNNFRTTVLKAFEAAKKDGREGLNDKEKAELLSKFGAYEQEYEFAGKRASRGPVDPVEREARKIAREIILGAMRAKGLSMKDRPEGEMDSNIDLLLSKRPGIREEAKKRVQSLKDMAAESLGEEIDFAPAAPAPQA